MKQVTFTEPMLLKKMVEASEEAVVCRVDFIALQIDPRTFKRSVHIQLGVYNMQEERLKVLDPILMDDIPDAWRTTLDTLDGKVLAEVKGTSPEGKSAVPDGTVGNFDAATAAAAVEAAIVAKAEAARVAMEGEVKPG